MKNVLISIDYSVGYSGWITFIYQIIYWYCEQSKTVRCRLLMILPMIQ